MDDDASHALVVGTPRSGTTLLTSLMGAHPECIALSECYSCEEHKVVSPAKLLVNKLCCPNQVQFTHPPPRSLPWRLWNRFWTKPISRLTERIIEDRLFGSMSISEYVEKCNARLVFIVRNPNQVVDSITRRGKKREEGYFQVGTWYS